MSPTAVHGATLAVTAPSESLVPGRRAYPSVAQGGVGQWHVNVQGIGWDAAGGRSACWAGQDEADAEHVTCRE